MSIADVSQQLHPQYGTRKKQKVRSQRRQKAIDWHNAHHALPDSQVLAIHQLRCNLASLVAESRIIRKEEKRCALIYAGTLRWHRVSDLREELRYTGLALAYVRSKKYRDVENDGSRPVDAARLGRKIRKFFYPGGDEAAAKLCNRLGEMISAKTVGMNPEDAAKYGYSVREKFPVDRLAAMVWMGQEDELSL